MTSAQLTSHLRNSVQTLEDANEALENQVMLLERQLKRRDNKWTLDVLSHLKYDCYAVCGEDNCGATAENEISLFGAHKGFRCKDCNKPVCKHCVDDNQQDGNKNWEAKLCLCCFRDQQTLKRLQDDATDDNEEDAEDEESSESDATIEEPENKKSKTSE